MLKFNNVKIKGDKGACEDTINLINSIGEINEIKITDAFSDALDLDFSNLDIDNVMISKSNNDCADFSFGNYNIEKFNLNNCGDKALSVGERSVLNTNEAIISNSNIGIASKDSSIINVQETNIKNTKECLAAYNKKQEFSGSYLKIKRSKCINYYKMIDKDKFSHIEIIEEI